MGIATMAVSPSPHSLQSMLSVGKDGPPESSHKMASIHQSMIDPGTYEDQKASMLRMLKQEIMLKTAVGSAGFA